jgi:hypothetical protein
MAFEVAAGERRRAKGVGRLLLGAALLRATAAAAQPVAEPRDFPVERFRWTFARTGVLGAEWAAAPEAGSWDVGLWFGTSNDPLVLRRDQPDGGSAEQSSLVAQRTSAALVFSYAPRARLELGAELPLVLAQSRSERAGQTAGTLSSIAGAGLGDLRLAAKLGLLTAPRHGLDVAILASLVVPSGGGEDYRGEAGLAVAPELLLSRQLGGTRVAANLGYRARRNARLLDLEVVDELYGVAAVAQRLGDGRAGAAAPELSLGLSLATSARSPRSTDNQDHLEVQAGVTWDAPGPLLLGAMAGAGIGQGFGTPDWLAVRFGELRESSAPSAHGAVAKNRTSANENANRTP